MGKSIMDIQLYFKEQGSGFPLVLLHGNGENHSYFVNQISYFSKQYRVIAIDTRGHGQSPRGEGEFSILRFANDLYEFFIENNISKAHILGFSDGANIALEFALNHADMVEKLILNGGNLFPAGIKFSTQISIEVGYRIARLFKNKSADNLKSYELLSLMVNQPNISPERLKDLSLPTLVVAGTKDMVKTKHTKLIANAIKNSRLALIDGDHFIANKNYKEFNQIVDSFLAEK